MALKSIIKVEYVNKKYFILTRIKDNVRQYFIVVYIIQN